MIREDGGITWGSIGRCMAEASEEGPPLENDSEERGGGGGCLEGGAVWGEPWMFLRYRSSAWMERIVQDKDGMRVRWNVFVTKTYWRKSSRREPLLLQVATLTFHRFLSCLKWFPSPCIFYYCWPTKVMSYIQQPSYLTKRQPVTILNMHWSPFEAAVQTWYSGDRTLYKQINCCIWINLKERSLLITQNSSVGDGRHCLVVLQVSLGLSHPHAVAQSTHTHRLKTAIL